MIRTSDLRFSYGTQPVVRGISLSVPGGTVCGVFGPNGSGKTTLFKCCLGLVRAPRGSISYDGRDLNRIATKDLAKTVAYVPREHQPPFSYLVKEIVLMGRTPHVKGGLFNLSEHDKSAAAALEALGIRHLADLRYDQMSGGQRQLVLIARAVAQETPILILDEPTSALDFANQARIWSFLRDLAAAGKTILTCSHDPNHVHWFCDRVITLHEGRVVSDGPPEFALTEPVLTSVYGQSYTVRQVDGMRVVLPTNRTTQRSPLLGRSAVAARGGNELP